MQGDNQQGYVETAPQRINAKGSRRRGKNFWHKEIVWEKKGETSFQGKV